MARKPLRSQRSYGKHDRDGFIHRSWIKGTGLPDHVFDGRPIIGVCNTWSELVTCQFHLRDLAEYVKRGVWEAGGVPIEFPAMSLPETQMRPTAMLFRNLLAMEVEESIRANPIDGVVLLGGCDKTTPGQLMGAASVDLPTMVVSSGPMLNGKWHGRDIGSGTDVWRFSEAVRAGEMSLTDFLSAESSMSRSHGTCNTMGTASTMASLMEALGVCLPNNAALPGVDSRRKTLAHLTGNRIVQLVKDDVRLSQILTREAFENAILMHAAIGGSTNAVVHLLALAGRVGIELSLEDFDRIGREVPLLVNLMPSGKYLMEEFCYAGGCPAVMKELGPLLRREAITVSGHTQGQIAEAAEVWNREVIGTREAPVGPSSGVWVLRGNLCPGGAILKPSAATPALLTHRGRAVVFEDIEDYHARIDDPDLPVDETSILVLKGCGPKGYPGMPEVGNMALPPKLLHRGVRDMVRISDARMSGTAYGTVILHVSPEAEAGGPLALVRNGDEIAFDGPSRTLDLLVDEAELARRRAEWEAARTPSQFDRGWYKLYIDTVLQADRGADLDFLVGKSSPDVTRESH
ncbi:dihydroxyacid dehydratase/phosphogluconate dehydratase [Phenylobacterium zucineum HLK1]|uniref:Dihydroxyacid dehydratase/phosphogluconate dehydratase n=1 Tax=Phenylobacterium zucineum (strain HLK1) TaxID=450851 RepID=B4RE52_PHEZH|nr:IlvD/Edd family dehydratase [Phenylobacterium zucineum]ACG78485.1 dihydroxyacid dehydratase/phosphogluconate dehydratase [Phenylobacterium zucineum HLK1]